MEDNVILLVEDNPSDVGLTRRALEKNRVLNEVVVAQDGQEALDYLFGTGPYAGRDPTTRPMLILLDLKLPKVDGLTVLQQVRGDARTRVIPVVVLTTSDDVSDIQTAYLLGANSYIRKPVDFGEFTEVVKQLGLYWLVLNQPAPKMR